MRASDLLGAQVRDASGARLGVVAELRLVGDPAGRGPSALRLDGLLVSPGRRAGPLLGYRRGRTEGPWLVRVVVRALRPRLRYVSWTDVDEATPGSVRLSVNGAAGRGGGGRGPARRDPP